MTRISWYSRVPTNAAFTWCFFLCHTSDDQEQEQESNPKAYLRHCTYCTFRLLEAQAWHRVISIPQKADPEIHHATVAKCMREANDLQVGQSLTNASSLVTVYGLVIDCAPLVMRGLCPFRCFFSPSEANNKLIVTVSENRKVERTK